MQKAHLVGLAELQKQQSIEQTQICDYTMQSFEFVQDSNQRKLLNKMVETSTGHYNCLGKKIQELINVNRNNNNNNNNNNDNNN